MTLDIKELRRLAEKYRDDDYEEDLDAQAWGEAVSPHEVLALLNNLHQQKFERDSAVAELYLVQQQLAAVTAARDELANIATGVVSSRVLQRVDVLRKVGR